MARGIRGSNRYIVVMVKIGLLGCFMRKLVVCFLDSSFYMREIFFGFFLGGE